jgi:NAD(P)-dependent dehydrogenase (short-subunit alcohol dehydrogenase family)
MNDKVCVVTGGTSGIGDVTARALAGKVARVIVIGRSPERVAATVAGIREQYGQDRADGLVGDLSSFAEVRRLADEIRGKTDRIDVLVNNAGGVFPKRVLSADVIEMTMALNHFSYYLLTNILLDTLKRSAPSRVVNVSSDAHKFARNGINETNLRGPDGYAGWRSYAESKLANILFSNELAGRLTDTGVTSNALHPGFVRTRFFEDKGFGGKVAKAMAALIAMTPEKGAETSIHVATAPELETTTGRYFEKCRAIDPAPAARDEAAARWLWDLSAEWTGIG